MKLALLLLAIFGFAHAAPKGSYSLKDDLDEFLALIPIEELKALYHKYENDPDIVKIVAYLKSEDFAKVVKIVVNVPEVQDLVSFIEGKGVPIIAFLNKIFDRLGLPHYPGSYSYKTLKSSRSWRDFLEEAKQLVPVDKIMALVMDKLANSEDFQELYEKIASLDYKKLHDQDVSHPEIVDLVNRLTAMGVDVQKIVDFIKSFFGWEYKSIKAIYRYNLKDDLNEFMALIPTEELKALYHKYENDPDIVKIVAYLKSEDFAKVVKIVVNVPEVQDLVSFIEGKGVPIIAFLNKIFDRLGLPHYPGSYSYKSLKSSRSWRDFLEEAKQLVPVDKIMALVMDKLANSEDFQELYEKIASLDYNKLHDQAMSHPEIVDLVNRLTAMGVDVQKIVDFIKSFFGWEYKSIKAIYRYNLKDDLNEFMALIPTEELKALYHKYENDPDIVKIVAYLKSEDFAKVVKIVVNVPEVQDLVSFIEGKGVPIIAFLNKIFDRLGLPHYPGSYSYKTLKSSRSWRDFLEEAKQLVPVDEIIALVMDKLANSADFQELYDKIASLDYKKLHDQAMSHPEIVDLVNRLTAMGVDVQKIVDFIKSFFGWE